MNPNTGEIVHVTVDEMIEDGLIPLTEGQERILTPMNASKRKGWMKNQPCVCGSKKKFKKCCWNKYSKRAPFGRVS